MMKATLDRIILSNPSTLDPASLTTPRSGAPRSWIQLAKTGSFVSNRYGHFSITRADLKQMLHNFRTVVPQAPTELPIDFDHLSMEAAKPGDGIAAGWIKDLELRTDGDELWGLCEWTPRAAEQIKNQEYRFVSPSFVTDYTDTRSGKKVGTTLLAAAITNHPFLHGMNALTLYNCAMMGELAVTAAANETHSPAGMVSASPNPQECQYMSNEKTVAAQTIKAARAFEQRVMALSTSIRSMRDAISVATTQDPAGAQAYRLVGIGTDTDDTPAPRPVLSLSMRPGEHFDCVVQRYAEEQGIPLAAAVREVSLARPDLVAAR